MTDEPIKFVDKSKPFEYKKKKVDVVSKDMLHDSKIKFETTNISKAGISESIYSSDYNKGKTFTNIETDTIVKNPSIGKTNNNMTSVNTKDIKGSMKGQSARVKAEQNKAQVRGRISGTGVKSVGQKGVVATKTAATSFYSIVGESDINSDMQNDPTIQGGMFIKDGLARVKSVKTTTENAVKVGKKSINTTVKAGKQAVKQTQKVAKATAEATKQAIIITKKVIEATVSLVTKGITFLIANPVVAIVVGIIAFLLPAIFMFAGAVSSSTKNIMGEELYTQLQIYTREKDKTLLLEFEEYENDERFQEVLSNNITKIKKITPSTSFKYMSAYLLALYEAELTYETGIEEIDRIHNILYSIIEEVGVANKEIILTVTLDGQTLKEYIEENKENLFTPEQSNKYDMYLLVDENTSFSGIYGTPFEDEGWQDKVTSEFGYRIHPITGEARFHNGIDFGMPEGTPIFNIMDGTVIEAGFNSGGYGYSVVIKSLDGMYTVRYAHMSAISVSNGDNVFSGGEIGLVGNTGNSTGPHLHLEVHHNGQSINPREVLPFE